MKKLIMAVAIVCAAAGAQAAQMNWYMAGHDGVLVDEDYGWLDGGQAYLVMVTDAANFAIADNLQITGGTIVDSVQFSAGEAIGTWQDTESLVGGQTYQFAMIGTTAGTGAKDTDGYIMPTTGFYGIDDNGGDLYSVTWNASTGGGFDGNMDGTAINLAVAPEPTSGLLLLLGVAGLALRRRRA